MSNTRYAHIEDRQIKTGPTRLPKAWKNISGFNFLTDEQLKEHGWLPWNLIEIEVGHNEVYGEPLIEIHSDRITETQTKRTKTPEELAQRLEERKQEVRNQRDYLLQETDWITIRALDTNQTVTEWQDYRQALRDITLQDNFPDVVWPVKPQ